jgi:nickel/cobalt exporter
MLYPLLIDSLALGVQHSFEPDHLAAVSVLSDEKDRSQVRKVIWRSSQWALGHAFTLIVFACLILLLKSQLSENVSAYAEWVVGPLMIALGANAILRRNVPAKPLAGRSFGVGMIHGLAGTGAACTAALTLAAEDTATAVWVIVLQSAAILLAMTLYGCFLAVSFRKWTHMPSLNGIRIGLGLFSILVGLVTLFESFSSL